MFTNFQTFGQFDVEKVANQIRQFCLENNITRDCKKLQQYLFSLGFSWGDLGTGRRDYTCSLRCALQTTSNHGEAFVVGTANRSVKARHGKFSGVVYRGYYLKIK